MDIIRNNITYYNTGTNESDVIIIASAVGLSSGILTAYIKNINGYSMIFSTDCLFGINGLTDNKTEGDGKTPLGIFELGIAFGAYEYMDIGIDYKKITDTMYWVDDIESEYYNKLIDTAIAERDFSSAEHLIDYNYEYEYAVSIEYNTKSIVPGQGSAIFLHCFSNPPKPTSGCISIKSKYMKQLLENMTSNSIIVIERSK